MKYRVRLLSIPHGATRDARGDEVGDDWLLAVLGEDYEGTKHYLTTDGVRCSDDTGDLADAGDCGRLLVRLLTEEGIAQTRIAELERVIDGLLRWLTPGVVEQLSERAIGLVLLERLREVAKVRGARGAP